MLVCHCNVVSDREIRRAIDAGARDPQAVADACGAGSDCLGCGPSIEQLLDDASMACHAPDELRSLQAHRRRIGVNAAVA